ncbi:MAG: putative chemiosmotic efflux system protein [Deltaproteobacteria bacterium]|nr:putative chemiosmotic efflux system protein [Deltaproteobacteria bacterium]
MEHRTSAGIKTPFLKIIFSLAIGLLAASPVLAEELDLKWLIDEALRNNREMLAAQSRVGAYTYKVPQAGSLTDPMFSFGYQNDDLNSYTYGQSPDSKWMFELSQTFPFAGKRGLKEDMAKADAESQQAAYEALQRRVISKVIENYYELFFVYKSLDIIGDRKALFTSLEEAALARYASGMAPQQDAIMAQAEKYMLQEKEEMLRQKIQTLEGMLNLFVGRDTSLPLGRPATGREARLDETLGELVKKAYDRSPEIRAKEKIIEGTEAKVRLAKKEYIPDVTLNAGTDQRGGDYTNMYKLTASINLPVYFSTRQEPAVKEASAQLLEAKHELEATKFIISSTIRENFAMATSAQRLMELYRNALIPKTSQDYEAALAAYSSGKADALTVVTRLKALIEFDILYWNKFSERQKAIARIGAYTGDLAP